MKTDSALRTNTNVEIKELELELAGLKLLVAKKEQQIESLRELQSKSEPIGYDRRDQPIFCRDRVKLLTRGTKAEFKGIKEVIVLGRSTRYQKRALVGKIGEEEVVTTRETYNLLVVDENHAAGRTKSTK